MGGEEGVVGGRDGVNVVTSWVSSVSEEENRRDESER